MPCCSAAIASSSNDETFDKADESCCATAADPGRCAHSDKNRNAPSDSVAICHVRLTSPFTAGRRRSHRFSELPRNRHRTGAAVDALLMHDTSRARRSKRRAAPAAAAIDVTDTPSAPAAAAAAEVAPAPAPAASKAVVLPARCHRLHPNPLCRRCHRCHRGCPWRPRRRQRPGSHHHHPHRPEAPRFHQPRP